MVALVETNQGKVFLVGMTWAINNQAIGNSVDLQGFLKTPLKAHSNIDFGTANSEQKHTIELMWESYTTLIPCIDITFDDLTSL